MPQFKDQKTLIYTPEQMYALAIDVESYPQFLPWCQAANIISRTPDSFVADLTIGFNCFHETFRSEVTFRHPNMIDVVYIGGPLKYLKTHWKFKAHTLSPGSQGCEVEFFVDFSFGNGLLHMASQAVFSTAVRQIMKAFENRAQALYS